MAAAIDSAACGKHPGAKRCSSKSKLTDTSTLFPMLAFRGKKQILQNEKIEQPGSRAAGHKKRLKHVNKFAGKGLRDRASK